MHDDWGYPSGPMTQETPISLLLKTVESPSPLRLHPRCARSPCCIGNHMHVSISILLESHVYQEDHHSNLISICRIPFIYC